MKQSKLLITINHARYGPLATRMCMQVRIPNGPRRQKKLLRTPPLYVHMRKACIAAMIPGVRRHEPEKEEKMEKI